MPTCTYLVERQGLPEPLDGIVCADKRECSATKNPDARNGIPEIQSVYRDAPIHGEERYGPHAKELYGYIATEDLLELRCQLVIFASRRLVELVRERDLLIVVLGEQPHLFAKLVSKGSCEPMSCIYYLMQHSRQRASCVRPTGESCKHPLGCRNITFSIRRKHRPKMQIRSPSW
jgi:hypothetical protein